MSVDSLTTLTPLRIHHDGITDVIDEYVNSTASDEPPFVDCTRQLPAVGTDESQLIEVAESMLAAYGLPTHLAAAIVPHDTTQTTMLIDAADMFVEEVTDVFCVDIDVTRARSWRTKIDASQPFDLAEYNSALLQQRAYHARMYYELALSVEIMDREWLSRKPVSMLRDAALVELRGVELRIASYQLSHQVVGIKGASRESMFKCALFAWNLHLYMFDELSALCKHQRGRGDVLEMKPSHTDAKKELAISIDTNIHACQAIVVSGLGILLQTKQPDYIHQLGKRMGLTVRALDDVLVLC